jgi:hypothetical protein
MNPAIHPKKYSSGYIYSIYSKDYKPNHALRQFGQSLASLKKTLPNAKVALYTNISDIKKFWNQGDQIDFVIYEKDMIQHHISKAHTLLKSPFFKNIFLDSDTIIKRGILGDIFDVLEDYELAGCYSRCWSQGTIYPDINTGLLGFKKNKKGIELINQWINLHKTQVDWCKLPRGPLKEQGTNYDHTHYDQLSFREMWIKNKKNLYILPSYFQARIPHFKEFFNNMVIYHGVQMNIEDIQRGILKSIK